MDFHKKTDSELHFSVSAESLKIANILAINAQKVLHNTFRLRVEYM